MSTEELFEKGIDLNVQRKENIYKCPICGTRMNRIQKWVLMRRGNGRIIFRKIVRPVGNVLLNRFKCSNCGWTGSAWDVLKHKDLTMYGTKKRRKTLQRYPFELFAKAKPHPVEEDRH